MANLASAYSRDLFGNNEMGFVRASEVSTDPFSQLLSRKQPIVLNHVALSMNSLWLNGIEPGALRGQKERQNAHSFSALSHLLVVLTNPGAHLLAHMPGGIIPDQEPVALALGGQPLTTVVQKLGGDGAHWTPGDKTQPHLVSLRLLWGPLLPQHAIAGQRFGVGIFLLPGLLHQAHGMVLLLPGVHARQNALVTLFCVAVDTLPLGSFLSSF